MAVIAMVAGDLGWAGTERSHWVLTDLGTLGGRYSVAVGVNANGQVVGTSTTRAGKRHVFLWEKGRMRDIGLIGVPRDFLASGPLINDRGEVAWVQPGRGVVVWAAKGVVRALGTFGGSDVELGAINNKGHLLARAKAANGRWHVILWQNGRVIDLGDDWSDALDINERGQIVGLINDRGHAVLWQVGKTRDLGTLGGKRSEAVALNDAGLVVGTSETKLTKQTDPWDGFLWGQGTMTDLGQYSDPTAINNRGQIIFGNRNYVWDGGQHLQLHTLGGRLTYAEAINNEGQVVGQSIAKFGERTQWHAFVWVKGVMIDLGVLRRGTTSDAVALNDKGEIVGTSDTGQKGIAGVYDPPRHAVLWTRIG
jgi:probable HAF family extracellular repeat protein